MAQNPIITFEMENGDIMKAELYPQVAPNTVNNLSALSTRDFMMDLSSIVSSTVL